jgi:glutamyl-tRNA synthetase
MSVVTRFAPSPTGYLHIGGARTALYNRLLADRHGGRMLLRIEDTDRERSTPEAVAAILDGLSWLGIRWDGDPIFQFARRDRHAEVALSLLDKGLAYRCYATADELAALRAVSETERRAFRFDSPWRDRDPAEAPEGAPFAVRLRAPRDGHTVVEDAVQGTVSWANADLDDPVLLRSDGTPTYMLAVVVDDHDMGVTQVIRGDDHLTNAARQAQIYAALGWDAPLMAHIPLILSPEGRKLSKREGAAAVTDYAAEGILPAALRNHLVRLGWGHGDQEIFSDAEMAAAFDLSAVGKGAARLDPDKLAHLNAHYLRTQPADDTLDAMGLSGARREAVRRILPDLVARARTVTEVLDAARFLDDAPPGPDALEPDAAAVLAKAPAGLAAAVASALDGVGTWDRTGLEAAVRSAAEALGAKLGAVAQPLRVALTGRTKSIGVFEILEALGPDESRTRIAAAFPAPDAPSP